MRARHLVPVAAFFVYLLVPLLQTASGLVKVRPIDENRKLAPAPQLLPTHPRATLVATKRWFEDHFGFRPFLIRLKTQIDYSVFHTSDRIHIGKDGFLFYRSVLDDERFVIDRLLQQRMSEVLGGVERLRDDLARRSKRLIILISPSKENLYPEMLPASVPHFPAVPQIDLLRDALRKIPGITFIDPIPLLQKLKPSHPVFYKTDAHWTPVAALNVGQMLLDEIARQEGTTAFPWRRPLVVELVPFSGGEARQMPLFVRPTENIESIKNPPPGIAISKIAQNVGSFAYIQEAAPEVPGLLPCLTVVGDSFWMWIQVTGPSNYLKGLYQATWHSFTDFKALLDAPSECKYFVYQFLQGNRLALETLANYR